MGVNFATASDLERVCFSKQSNCVFISHKKEDENAAITIGQYLTDIVDINIYLDIKDCTLQEAVSTENDAKIVNSIQKGLDVSSHLLCLISDKTKLSWWVPYEIGYATKAGIDIASLQLKTVDDIPSYLKTNNVITSIDDFNKYIKHVLPYNGLFSDFTSDNTDSSTSTLLKYIR